MPSKIDVVNQTLSELGRQPIADILNSDDANFIISPKMDLLSKELLLRTDWNFAIKYVTNDTPLSTSFSPDYLYTYQLPADFGKFDRISDNTTLSVNFGLYYRLIDGYILTNARPINFYYVVNQVDYAVITPLFERLLAIYTASDVSLVLTNNAELTAYLRKKYEDMLKNAIIQNDTERYVQSTPYNDFDRQAYI